MATPDLLTPLDDTRARRLRSMKRNAAGLLLLAAAVFILTYVFSDGSGWAGYVRATSEAAMVGGVADWFAVTALFQHPLGLPIPHTAIIPRGKDAIGKGLGEFVQRNFMDPESLVERIEEADPAGKLGTWLSGPENAAGAARQAAGVIAAVAESLQDGEIQGGIREMITSRIEEVEIAPLVSTVLEKAISDGHHEAAITAGLRGISKAITDNQEQLRKRVRQESPSWVPGVIDDIVFDKLYSGLQSFLGEIAANPNHEVRVIIDRRLENLTEQLQDSVEFRSRSEQLKQQILAHPSFTAWSDNLWGQIKAALVAAAEQPDSEVRVRLEQLALTTGERLQRDPELRASVDAWIGNLAGHLATRSGPEVASLIESTVQRWDAVETSRRLELQVGRDLQFIRINGTIVGGLVGLIIHAAVDIFG